MGSGRRSSPRPSSRNKARGPRGRLPHRRGERGGASNRQIVGTLTVHPDGFGFVRPTDTTTPDVYIPRGSLDTAMHGDRVVVQLARAQRPGRREGRVEKILVRAVTTVVGTFRAGRRSAIVMPRDPRLRDPIVVPRGREGEARDDDVVLVTLTRHPARFKPAEGRVDDVLGRSDDPRIDTDTAMASHGLPRAFPEACEVEARRAPRTVTDAACAGRQDLRGLALVTIDGETARDFDDAVHVARTPQGFRATIAIADVAHYVPTESALDLEALARGTSVYFPDRVVPMLPESLSNGICSLNPDVDRLVLAATLDFDPDGHVRAARFAEAVMRSRARLTYTRVRRLLVDRDAAVRADLGALAPMLHDAEALARALMARRRQRGAIDFDLPEAEIVLDAHGNAVDARRTERSIANQLIEELMLAANEAVARELLGRKLPFLHRVHEPPAPDVGATLARFLEGFGLRLLLEDGQVTPRSIQQVAALAAERPEARLVHSVLLRAMTQARYDPEPLGHFGLATATYCHFTSPIRRYPDLLVHRTLKAALRGQKDVPADLAALGLATSTRERVAMEAEREVVAIKKVRVMEPHVGASFPGCVASVTPFGFFVELLHPFVEGLVHVSSLEDDFYEHDPDRHCLRGRRSRRTIRPGDPVRVRLVGVSLERRAIDFVLEDHTCTERPSPRPSRRSRRS